MKPAEKRTAKPGQRPSSGLPPATPLPANQFRRAAKFDETTLIRLAFCFCNGIPVHAAAASVNLSTKTVRSVYLEFRQRLTHPKFNHWHGAYQRLVNMPSIETEMLVRVAFIDTLAECGLNETCYRNYRLGNRKARLCRGCPLPNRLTAPERVSEALEAIDAVQSFYERIGIRGESQADALSLFRLRLIHTTTIATSVSSSRRRKNGLADPAHREHLSVGTLLDTLLSDLADRSLQVARPECRDASDY